ncbi:polysaccharide deacetylase [Clostridium sp. 19966]|nr:polysaccharide deacetylase [Clostridium sp. 19966]
MSYSKKEVSANASSDNTPKEMYLTFDDGPTPGITDKILDSLKENNVKATFFLVGKEIEGREELVERIYREGHSIGLHTYSHKFSIIYKSEDNFIDELKKTQDIIYEITKYKATAVRFPGGSDKMLSQSFLDRLHQCGYTVYDWNSNLQDGEKARLSTEQYLNNSKKIKGDKNRVFLLAHNNSNNKNTAMALGTIINHYRSQEFEFKTIDNDTKEYYYKFKKK